MLVELIHPLPLITRAKSMTPTSPVPIPAQEISHILADGKDILLFADGKVELMLNVDRHSHPHRLHLSLVFLMFSAPLLILFLLPLEEPSCLHDI